MGGANALRIASINDFARKGFERNATLPASKTALRVVSLSLPVMNMTGSEIPASARLHLPGRPHCEHWRTSKRRNFMDLEANWSSVQLTRPNAA
jgi:hypothetical protein